MPKNNNVICHTLGCKINQCETEKMKNMLPDSAEEQVVMVNTCCVTNRSEYESRQAVRKAVRSNPDAVIMAVGCAVEKNPSSFSEIPGVDYVVGNRSKNDISNITISKQDSPVHKVSKNGENIGSAYTREGRTRAFVKVQDGCDSSCSYCIVPTVRGASVSVPMDVVLDDIRLLVSENIKEIVMTGIHLGKYGVDASKNTSLASLLEKIIAIPGDFRIRLSSIEQGEITDDLLAVIADPKVCPHIHIPLQSGDDNVLARMNRQYTTEHFARVLERIIKLRENISIGTDVIVGFPAESEQEFSHTYDFLKSQPFSYFHVFRYSERAGTAAASMSGQIHGTLKKERSGILRKLGSDKLSLFKEKCIGKHLSTLVLREEDGIYTGLTDNYIHLPVAGKGIKLNNIVSVLVEVKNSQIMGVLTDD